MPLDLELYQQANSLPDGKKDPEFKKKPELALSLIDRSLTALLRVIEYTIFTGYSVTAYIFVPHQNKKCCKKGYRSGIVLIDSGYVNNTSFLIELEHSLYICVC